MPPRLFWPAAALLLGFMLAAQVTSARLEVQTADEAVHLVSGYSILRRARFGLNAENPPVGKVLSALPLLWLNPDLPPEPPASWQDENSVSISGPFLYRNRLPADRILFWGRVPTMLLTLAFGLALAVWTRHRFGGRAALIALALFCFDPNLIAHGRYVTSDVCAACFLFLAAVAWGEYLEGEGRRRIWLVLAAAVSATGICTKFNLSILPPLLLALALWHARYRRPRPAARVLRDFGLYLAIVAPVIWAIYGFETRTVASDEPVARFLALDSAQLRASRVLPAPAAALLDPATAAGKAIHWTAAHLPIPAYSFWKGLYRLYNHSYWGHRGYLLGEVSMHGWWYYFPVAFLVKTPTGVLLLLLLAAVSLRGMRTGGYPLPLLLLPPALYFAAAIQGPINIGLRHILPVYAFLFVWIGIAAAQARGAKRIAAAAGLLLAFAESAAIYPDYLAFFNTPSGGSRNGPTYLLDSNIDWGQDLLKLKRYMTGHQLPSIALAYFGSADPAYYQVPFEPLDEAVRGGKRGPAAFSVSNWQMRPEYAWLRNCQPAGRVGYSIYIYDLNSPTCPVRPGTPPSPR